jgi:arginine N-succinyltransferase
MNLPIIRPAKLDDLQTYIHFAEESGYGITSLPRNATLLEKKLLASERAFHEELVFPLHETYQFCLEFEGKVIGICGIVSRIGMSEPFFAYHLLHEHCVCDLLNIDKKIAVLHFTKARKKPTEIGSLFLAKNFRGKNFGKLLSFSRFLFIATFKHRFAPIVIAELRGINSDGYAPFWEAIGRPFFQMDFPKADLLRKEQLSCIEELFPQHPIYVDLLAKEVQNIIGVTHPETFAARKLLEKQGFKTSHYLDLFDGGPHLYAHTDEIHAVVTSKESVVNNLVTQIDNENIAIVANTHLKFRATLSSIILEKGGVTIPKEAASALNVNLGSPIRYYIIAEKEQI